MVWASPQLRPWYLVALLRADAGPLLLGELGPGVVGRDEGRLPEPEPAREPARGHAPADVAACARSLGLTAGGRGGPWQGGPRSWAWPVVRASRW